MRTEKHLLNLARWRPSKTWRREASWQRSGWRTDWSGLNRQRCPGKRLKWSSSGLADDHTAKDRSKARG